MAHKVFLFFLFFLALTVAISIGVSGCNYYFTPFAERAFHPDYVTMRPSGNFSHGIGILGSLMIIVGVAMYSGRKRIRSLWNLGKLTVWLEVHIFLCVLGPVLVAYHTTFKAGGIAAISLWCMLSVAASGIIGRFLYVKIPRNIKGVELDAVQIDEQMNEFAEPIKASPIGAALLQRIDGSFENVKKPVSFFETVQTFVKLELMKRTIQKDVKKLIQSNLSDRESAEKLYSAASSRTALIEKKILLAQAEKFFYYWHVIHLPFTIIMFITLIAHIIATVLMGYHWIF